jgi:RloB-like protein
MSERHKNRKQRRPVFLGCEGLSEVGYGALIRDILNSQREDIHLDVKLLKPGGGDPLALLEIAESILIRARRQGGYVPYKLAGILLDCDLLGKDKNRDKKAFKIAEENHIKLIWQNPCHEALLLRHIKNCETLQPSTNKAAFDRLKKEWPDYSKGMSKSKLEQLIAHDDILRAASVESDLKEFLISVGYLFS